MSFDSDSSSSPLDRLPAVLVQLSMHWMTLGEMLRFARCSHQLLSQADLPFAFRFVKPMRVGLFTLPEPDIEPATRLLRHVSMSAFLDRDLELTRGADPLPILCRLPTSVRSFTISDFRVRDPGVLLAMAQHPSTQHLTSLTIGEEARYPIDAETMKAIARMPQLTSLVLRIQHPTAQLVRELGSAAALTSLSLNDSSFRAPSILDGLSDCVRLRHLSVQTPWIYTAQFISIFATPCFRGLESMLWDHTVLYGDESQPAMETEWARRAFASMHALREFTVRLTFGIDELMPALSVAPALRLFTIDANCSPRDTSQIKVLPSPELTCTLLRDAPALSIVLDMSAFHHDLRTEYAESLERALAQMDEASAARLTLRRCNRPIPARE